MSRSSITGVGKWFKLFVAFCILSSVLYADRFIAVGEDHEYSTPKRAVLTIEDMQIWEKTEAYFEYVGFFTALNESVRGKAVSSKFPESPNIQTVINLLDTMDQWITEYPPVEQPQRFGNQAFKSWYKRLSQVILSVLNFMLNFA